jgi:hypothetical protein
MPLKEAMSDDVLLNKIMLKNTMRNKDFLRVKIVEATVGSVIIDEIRQTINATKAI